MKERDVKFVTHEAGDVRIAIVSRDDGFFQYWQDVYYHPAPEEGFRGGWYSQGGSGIFETLEDAERDARQSVPWLRDQISN